jgi:hypothetical protein
MPPPQQPIKGEEDEKDLQAAKHTNKKAATIFVGAFL